MVPPCTLPAKFAMSGVISTVIASWWLGRFIVSNVIRNSFVKVLKLLRGRLRGSRVGCRKLFAFVRAYSLNQ